MKGIYVKGQTLKWRDE